MTWPATCFLGALALAGRAAAPAPAAGHEAPHPQVTAAFGHALERAVEARLGLLPQADAVLQAIALRCAERASPTRPRAFVQARPMLIGLPSGRVLVSTGLIAACESDAELASALAHEAGHLARGDLLDRLERAYGHDTLARIARGEASDVLGGMAANIAAGGVMTRHGAASESAAEDAARAAGCEGGLARILERAASSLRARRPERRAHPIAAPTGASFPAGADPAVTLLGELRQALGPLP